MVAESIVKVMPMSPSLQKVRILALGRKPSEYDAQTTEWLEEELARCLNRLTRTHSEVTAMVSLAPGVGLLWANVAAAEGVPLDVWMPHPTMIDHWPFELKRQVSKVIEMASEFAVPFAGPRFEPYMHQKHMRVMAAEANVVVTVSSGGDEFPSGLVPVEKPIYLVDPESRQVTWCPRGRA